MVVSMAKKSDAPVLMQTIEIIGGPWCGEAYQTTYREYPCILLELIEDSGKTWCYRMCNDGRFRLMRHAEAFDNWSSRKGRHRKR